MTMREIEDLRREKREEIMEVLKKQLEATQKNHINQYPRLKFINNFQLYHGLSKFYAHVSKKNDPNGAAERIRDKLDQFDQDLMSIFDCDESWPLCLYDFRHKNACTKFVAMRVQQPLNFLIIEDYWYSKNPRTEANQLQQVIIKAHQNENITQVEVPFDQLII